MTLDSLIGTISEGDCLDMITSVPDNSIDLTFADPPFNLDKKYGVHDDNMSDEAYIEWCDLWLREMVRVTKPTGSIIVHNIPRWLTHFSQTLNEVALFRHWISWNAPSAMIGKQLQPSHYGILFYSKSVDTNHFRVRSPHKRCRKCGCLLKDYGGKKDAIHPYGPLLSDMWDDIHRIRHKRDRDDHPCQLPVHLLERIILMSTNVGDVVLDPFSGSGSTAVAAKQLGRQWIAFDNNPYYVDMGQDKLAAETTLSKIGDAWVSIYRNKIVTLRDCDWSHLSQFHRIPLNKEAVEHTPIKLYNTPQISWI